MNPTDPAHPDALAVEAIRQGDRERFQELVERHADRVFAVAWSRLGNRDLAEEAAQEAFITAYQRLPRLGHTARFGSWIAAIARNTAINLGIRRRNHLRKDARWALEQDQTTQPPNPPGSTPEPTDTLRQSLEDLPPIHRECLVLFYLENRSIAEAAATLGISDNTFKVRLHRARTALRDVLESRLESGLDQLRAPARLTHAVMLAIPTHTGGLLASGSLASAAAKWLPFSFTLFALQFSALLPGLILARWLALKDLANFRDPLGFRPSLYRAFLRSTTVTVVLALILTLTLVRVLGPRTFATIAGAFFLLLCLDFTRRLHVIRTPVLIGSTLAIAALSLGLLATGLANLNPAVLLLAHAVFALALARVLHASPPRMDHSLFTRAAHGLLPPQPTTTPLRHTPPSPSQNLEFARFLGRHHLVENWRTLRDRQGLELRLPRVLPNTLTSAVPFLWLAPSTLRLHADGTIDTSLGNPDRQQLAVTCANSLPGSAELQARVAHALHQARTAFLSGNPRSASSALGEVPESSVFNQPHLLSTPTRWRSRMLNAAAILLVAAAVIVLLKPRLNPAPSRFQTVAVTEDQTRDLIQRLNPAHPHHSPALAWWDFALQSALILPPPGSIPESTRTYLVARVLDPLHATLRSTPSPAAVLEQALNTPAFLRAANLGFLQPDDLKAVQLDHESVRSSLRALEPSARSRFLALHESPVFNNDCSVLNTDSLALRVEFLERSAALDPADLAPVVPTLLAAQVLSPDPIPGRCMPPDPAAIHGLFHSRFNDSLRDTRDVLRILHAAQAIHRIDREACIAGILRWHRGQGLIQQPPTLPKSVMGGDAANTWCAFECLRLLNGLDRVPDLADWRFRTSPGILSRDPRHPDAPPLLVWPAFEAHLLAQHFATILPDLPVNPTAARP